MEIKSLRNRMEILELQSFEGYSQNIPEDELIVTGMEVFTFKTKQKEKGKNVPKKNQEGKEINLSQRKSLQINEVYSMPNQIFTSKMTQLIENQFRLTAIVLIDSGTYRNCIKEGIVPYQYLNQSFGSITVVNKETLLIRFKPTYVDVCNKEICIRQHFIVLNMNQEIILENFIPNCNYLF